MLNFKDLFIKYGKLGVTLLQEAVRPYSATNKTEKSIKYQVDSQEEVVRLALYARPFFSTIETGRGPRKSNDYQGFDDSMLEYMEARGIGSDLNEKKRKQLARFLTLKINREGDKTYKAGGREVYSKDIEKFVREFKDQIKQEFKNQTIKEIRKQFKQSA